MVMMVVLRVVQDLGRAVRQAELAHHAQLDLVRHRALVDGRQVERALRRLAAQQLGLALDHRLHRLLVGNCRTWTIQESRE